MARSVILLVVCIGILFEIPAQSANVAGLSVAYGDDFAITGGYTVSGAMGMVASVTGRETAKNRTGIKPIAIVTNNLRRVYLRKKAIVTTVPTVVNISEVFRFDQPSVITSGGTLASVGTPVNVTPFDQWGRRVYSLQTQSGVIHVQQGITQIDPEYVRVQSLVGGANYSWDMRLATSSFSRDKLKELLFTQIDPQNPDERLRLVRLYIEANRFHDARLELAEILAEFPELEEFQQQLTELTQMGARQIVDEIKIRQESGQYNLVSEMIELFPVEGISGEILLELKEIQEAIEQKGSYNTTLLESFGQIAQQIKNEAQRKIALDFQENVLASELKISTQERLTTFASLAKNPAVSAEEKIALAISGWYFGTDHSKQDLALALSLPETYRLSREYLTESSQLKRQEHLKALLEKEGSAPEFLSKVLALMKPLLPLPDDEYEGISGLYLQKTVGLRTQENIEYFVQLPPEYDPHRKYPCVVTLAPSGKELWQIDWWAGQYRKEERRRYGQASRHGYIVLSPKWQKKPSGYKATLVEQAAVLHALRDAHRYFSIDTDRVYLSGHSAGGTAAWDIGMAHPDLWAGVIPIGAYSTGYTRSYRENTRFSTAFMFVLGELDNYKVNTNSSLFDDYLSHFGYDCVLVEYIGRGNDHFFEELPQLFRWMNGKIRTFPKEYGREYEYYTLRPWDNFFYWLEVEDLPKRNMIAPELLGFSSAKPAKMTFETTKENFIRVRGGASTITVCLNPDLVDFEKVITIYFGGNKVYKELLTPKAEALLEDVRTRGDRQHPFWTRLTFVNGRLQSPLLDKASEARLQPK
ncbi:MAG: tetratricopeptide repeat protein [Pirellulaceae bacterium]|nr:tetratricopeptide repeat protein [Pirellulaceae bacterium]